MGSLQDETGSHEPLQRVWAAVVATDAVDLLDRVSVVIPGLNPNLRWDDCRWQARDDASLPKRGDECVVVIDDTSETWIVGWWPETIPAPSTDGWVAIDQTVTLTYSSWDATVATGVVTTGGVDLTGIIPLGARLKFTQTTVKYFVVTAISSTTITLYGGTDYTLINAAITLPSYSLISRPFGFNTNPLKWQQEFIDSTIRTQNPATPGTWYNLPGSLWLFIPIGAWDIDYMGSAFSTANDTHTDVSATLSTANNSEFDSKFTSYGSVLSDSAGGTTQADLSVPFMRNKSLLLAAKTQYFANIKTDNGSIVTFENQKSPLIIRARCAYL